MKSTFKNKWLLFVLFIWIIIFATPPLRNHLRVWCDGSPWINFTLFPNHHWTSQFGPNSPELPVQVEAAKGGIDTFVWPRSFETLHKLDNLIQKNPDLPWLIALRLQVTTGVFGKNRVGGELADENFYQHLNAGIPSPETNGQKLKFTPQQMAQTLSLCRRGEKLEPQNAFFSWMRMYFLMINWQDKKALQALSEASHKTYWNIHYLDFQNLYLQSVSKILKRPLLPTERITFYSMDLGSFGASKREMGRILNWEGIKLKRQGKHAQALQIWSDFHHTMALATQGDTDVIDYLVDYAMLQIAQSGATSLSRKERKQAQHNDDLRPDHQQSYEAKWNERTSGFINYAKKHGRLDLAQQIKDDAHQAFATFQKERVYIDVSTKTFDYNYNLLQFSDLLSIAGVVLMLSLLSSFIVWIIISIYELFLTRKSTFLLERYSPQLSESILGIIACSALWSILCSIILSAGLVTITNTTPGTLADLSNGWLLLPFSVHFYFDNFINKVLEFSGITHQKDYFLPTWRVLILLTPILMGSLYVLQKRIEWQAKSNGKKVWSGWALFRRFFSRRWDRPFVIGLLGWIGKRIFILLFFLCWGALTFTSQFMNAEDQTNQIILAVFTIALLLSALFWLIRVIKPASFPYGFQLFKQSIAGWISFASVLILAILIGSVIINRPLQKWSDTEMRGEMWQIHRVKNMPAIKR